MPAGSKTDPPLAKAKPISASVITYLRREKNMNEGSERVALVGTWPPGRVNPPQQQAGQLGEAGFKLRDSGGRVQSANAHATATNWGISQANQSSDKCSLAASQDENQKTNHLKGIYANARSLGNKQEELELRAQSESYDIIGITETWWDNSHDWRTTMDGYRLFHKDRQGRRERGVALYFKENLECIEVNYSDCGSPIECLWVKIRGVVSKGDLTVGVYYQPPNQDDKNNEAIFGSLKQASGQQNLVLMGDINCIDICWKNNTAAHMSQNHRMVWVGRDLKIIQFQPPCCGQGHPPLVPHHPHSKEFLSNI
ncbi:hypothetical protein GRJ2_003324800 [Grus japonensis]|uniref:Endonuclease/exonuclease/phosphatase domain-containing protein n=1 Tax=Grus japonensis TaxID=30415 RepID=A0ABC9YG80_GRUJA